MKKKPEIYSAEELAFFQELENEIDNGEYQPLLPKVLEGEKLFYKQVAVDTIVQKTRKKSLNIRLIESDIEKIKVIAFENGLPYHTLISSIIHKVTTAVGITTCLPSELTSSLRIGEFPCRLLPTKNHHFASSVSLIFSGSDSKKTDTFYSNSYISCWLYY
jgi:predicted DNA binding CopG/RHH family protein